MVPRASVSLASRRALACLVGASALVGVGCPKYIEHAPTAAFAEQPIERIAVAPFVGTPAMSSGHVTQVRAAFVAALRQHGFAVVDPDRTDPAVTTDGSAPPATSPAADALRHFPAPLAADAVLLGVVERITEREGSDLGAAHPASLAFHVQLYRPSDGALLWTGRYDETQRPASENLGDALLWPQRGARWLTVEELARFGAEDLAAALAGKE